MAISMVTANSSETSSLDLAKAQAALQAKKMIYEAVGKENKLKRTYIKSFCISGLNVWSVINSRLPDKELDF